MIPDQEIGRLLQEATTLHRAGDLDAAEKIYRKILEHRPQDPDALHLLGVIADARGDNANAVQMIKRALKVRDDFPLAHYHLAHSTRKQGDLAAAEQHVRRALHYDPASVPALCELAVIFSLRGEIIQALEVLRSTLKQHPGDVDTHIQLARTYRIAGDIPEMREAIHAGLAAAPQHPTLLLMLSEVKFATGDLKEGWANYRLRFQSPENRVTGKNYALPEWRGEDLSSKNILIWTEQGPGDEVMYASMLSELAARARRCAFQCSPRSGALMKRSFPDVDVFDRDLTPEECSAFDVQAPLAGMGEWLRADLAQFPPHTGYLRADPSLRARLRVKYEAAANGRCIVGIAWRTAAGFENASDKSVGVFDWGPILHVPGMTFVNLQYGDTRAELAAVQKAFGASIIHDDTVDPLKDLDAFAAQVAAMDVVVTSSNTAAHFAGALGIPTLCMLPISLGRGRRWYWFAERGRCPWYPTMQLFLQSRWGQWIDVIRDAGLALMDFGIRRGAISKPAAYLRSLGKAFSDAGAFEHAGHVYLRLAREPGLAGEGYYFAAAQRKAQGDEIAALGLYDQAIAREPAFFHAYNEKGLILVNRGEIEQGIACYREGLKFNSQSGELHNNLGSALQRLGRSAAALEHFKEAARWRPGTASIHVNMATALDETNDVNGALREINEAIRLKPEHVDAHYNKAQVLLADGRLEEGWREFTWRLKRAGTKIHHGFFTCPVWNGENLAGKNVLLWTEQGLGDEILMGGLLPDLLATGAKVTMLCSGRMVPLLRRAFPDIAVENLNLIIRRAAPDASPEERDAPLPAVLANQTFHFQMSLAEMGAAFRPNMSHFSRHSSYLKADTALRDDLRAKYLANSNGKRLVGISWRSHRGDDIDGLKSRDLSAWGPILAVPNVAFVNLQYGDCAQELAAARQDLGVNVIHDDTVNPLQSMDVFAAQVAAMDLVISVSNTTVHTAGALGTPVWVLLAEGRGRIWYWFRDRTDSPWYPSARLIRQKDGGDWRPVIARCAENLRTWAPSPLPRS